MPLLNASCVRSFGSGDGNRAARRYFLGVPAKDTRRRRAVCRSTKHGGRRCPGCGSYGAAAKANGNRRLGRLARKKVVDHLTEQGLVATAKAILAAPPSVLPEFMKAMGIEESVLGDTPLPSTHANPPSAGLLIAAAKAEQAALSGPQISPEEQAREDAQEALAGVDAREAGVSPREGQKVQL